MPSLLHRGKYELLALAIAIVTSLFHWSTSPPIAGLSTTRQGSAAHRFVQSIEGRVTDVLFRVRGARPGNPDVVIMQLDERGAQRWGLWPWSRHVLATAIDRLLDADVKVIGLDVSFTDESTLDRPTQEVLSALEQAGELPANLAALKQGLEARVAESGDAHLEAVLRKAGPRVVQGLVPFTERETSQFSPETMARFGAAIAPQVITRTPGSVKNSYKELALERLMAFELTGVQAPLARFATTGNRYAHFGTVTDVDGTIRRAATLAKLSNPPGLIPSLGTEVGAQFLDATLAPVVIDDELTALELRAASGRTVRVPFQDEVAFTLLDYPGPIGSFLNLSVVDVFDGNFSRDAVAGKAVLVGVTITGSSGDQRVTPYEELTPGLVTHAALLSNILSGDFLDRPPLSRELEMVAMIALALLLSLSIPRVGFRWKILLVLGVVGGWSLVSYLAFTHGLRVAWFVPVSSLLIDSFALIFLGYLSVDREKLRLRSTFSRYLGEDVMDLAIADPEKLNRGEKREMTVLFSDIRGFTSLAEHMSPEKLAAFINEYLSPMTRIIFEEKGTLDKYIGDAVMAFWNAPIDQRDHALRACRAAVKMLQKLDELKVGWKAAGYPALEIGIGINTGPMVVGNMGSDVRVDYTVLGDAVNLGSRLEGTNKEYETRIVISETTWDVVKHDVVARHLGAVRVKGRREPVAIFELRGLGQAAPEEATLIATFEAALEAWKKRDFGQARALFKAVLEGWPLDAPSRLYLDAIERLEVTPPAADWDGVVTLTTK